MRFCDICENLLKFKQIEEDLYYVCEICDKKYNLNPEDTKLKSIHVNIVDNVYKKNKKLIELFKEDDTLKLIEKECIKCKNNIMKQAVIGNNMNFIFICYKCKNIQLS